MGIQRAAILLLFCLLTLTLQLEGLAWLSGFSDWEELTTPQAKCPTICAS